MTAGDGADRHGGASTTGDRVETAAGFRVLVLRFSISVFWGRPTVLVFLVVAAFGVSRRRWLLSPGGVRFPEPPAPAGI